MDEVLWAVGRTSGIVSLLLFTAAVVLGILVRGGRALPGLPRFAVGRVHRDVSLLATVFLVLHVLTLLGDSYAQMSLVDLVIPFLGEVEPFWQGLGTVALDLVLAVVLTSALRTRLPAPVFRAVHLGVYPMWALALLHSLGVGTDAGTTWFLALAGGSFTAVALALLWRLAAPAVRTSPAARAEHLRTDPFRSSR